MDMNEKFRRTDKRIESILERLTNLSLLPLSQTQKNLRLIESLKNLVYEISSKQTTNPSLSLEVYENNIKSLEKEVTNLEEKIRCEVFFTNQI